RQVREHAAVLELEFAAAMQSEMAVTSLRRAEIEDGGEMHRGNLPAVFEVASVDAELLEQRSRPESMAGGPCGGLAFPLGIDLHVWLLASGNASYQASRSGRLSVNANATLHRCRHRGFRGDKHAAGPLPWPQMTTLWPRRSIARWCNCCRPEQYYWRDNAG